jgi:excisionase family DNA binding protein
MDLMTSSEAGAYLRLSERKLYELVARGAIPCTKVTGRWLFARAELDRWISAGMIRPEGLGAATPPGIVGGSHDPLLEWALRESGSALAVLAEGSEMGLARLVRGEVAAAAIHLHALDGGAVDANVEAAATTAALHDAVLIAFARREQGLMVAPGNPLGLVSIADAAQAGARFAMRPRGAGAQLLLLALLRHADIRLEDLARLEPVCATGADVAQAVRAGHAQAGIATRAVAQASGLGFVPLLWERFDLVMRQRDYFRPPLQALMAFLRGPAFTARAAELGGFDVTETGRVRFVS